MMASKANPPYSVPGTGGPSSVPAAPDRIGAWLDAARAARDPLAHVAGLLRDELRRDRGPNPVWISKADDAVLDAQLARLGQRLAELGGDAAALPLFGVPFAVKDNIDVAGFETTAGCPAFAYRPEVDAAAVERLREAGAIVLGKTNLDQFATGLNGTRSPFGPVANALDARYVSGGSSSGSAVAVARGDVLFSLGTDTAGSGRVPATLNGLVGVKPTRGLLSARGVVPACRSLDCVSIFAHDLPGAQRVLDAARGFDAADPYSRDPLREALGDAGWRAPQDRLSVPANPEFFGDAVQRAAWEATLARLREAGVALVEVDIAPLGEIAQMLYGGPWVAERDAAVGDFARAHPEAVHPVVRAIVTGHSGSARDAFESAYRMAALRRQVEGFWREHAALLLPGVPTLYTLAQMLADPVELNSRLGVYTNFANLLDLAALNVPAGLRTDGLPFGVSLIGAGFSDDRLLGLAARLAPALVPGAPRVAPAAPAADAHSVPIAVVGAHLSGLPLNGQLTSRGARLVSRTRTAATYRLYALPGTTPPRPGMVRDPQGSALEIEVWALPRAGWASFIEGIPAPLAIGSVQTEAGDWVKGFLCEPHALEGAREVTGFGGWRAYIASLSRH
ncbi:MAG: allophanate hydrolase [Burkholderiales bacterium]|nr:allophanate hydrolase [Burkholderiales bacterium]